MGADGLDRQGQLVGEREKIGSYLGLQHETVSRGLSRLADQGLIAGLERELLAHADGVLYSSRAFLESERSLTGDRARFLDHGVDTRHFAPRGRTGALAALQCPRPVIGFFGGLGHYCVIRALQLAPAALLSPLGYAELVGATFLGWLVFANVPDALTWAGAAVIIASGLYVAGRRA